MNNERMQFLSDFFSKSSKEDINSIFKSNHFIEPTEIKFSNKTNIIIGKNGSGKTRFLKAIKELYQSDDLNCVMYGYFPALADTYVDEDKSLPDYSLYEFLHTDNATFDDLLRAIELYGLDFVSELILYRSKRQKEKNDDIWNSLVSDFGRLTGKSLEKEGNELYVRIDKDFKEPLVQALKWFSPGETMLLYISIFLALQKNNNKPNKIIILDEPESHLHPKALLDFVKTLLDNNFKTVWIATHNLFLVPEFDFNNIFLTEDGSIKNKKSSLYAEILKGLLGENREKTEEFFSSLSYWQYSEFIAECFMCPEVIDIVDPKDEQIRLFVKSIIEKTQPKHDEDFYVLDFGGGSARLGKSLKLLEDESRPRIKYEIYDRDISRVDKNFVAYNNLAKINKKYDCVVMMNVLHEIEPEKWKEIFDGIYKILMPTGYLLFVEVAELTKGEMPNDTGYFVLGKRELEALFNSRKVAEIKIKETQKSVCFAIGKQYLRFVNDESINKAISLLKSRAFLELKGIRTYLNDENKHKEKSMFSRKYAFWCQQYINAELFLSSGYSAEIKKEYENIVEKKKKDLKAEEAEKLLSRQELLDSPNILVPFIRVRLMHELSEFRVKGEISDDDYWQDIILLESSYRDKTVIGILLKAAMLIGDKRCENRFFNNGYDKFV